MPPTVPNNGSSCSPTSRLIRTTRKVSVRLFLYANDIELQGLVATTSTWKRSDIAPGSIHAVINAYAKVHENLLLHDSHYPAADALHALVKSGQPASAWARWGGKDSAIGSSIGPGGGGRRPAVVGLRLGWADTLAQALLKLRATRSPAELERLIAKLRVYTISDQDDSGPWMRRNFPICSTSCRPAAITAWRHGIRSTG